MRTRRDWQGLERKIFNGKSVEDAAIEMGIAFEEAEAHVKTLIRRTELEDLARLKDIRRAEKAGLEVLITRAQAGPGSKGLEDSSDVMAAKALLDYALKAHKQTRDTSRGGFGPQTLGSQAGERDLFDRPVADVKGPWDLTDPKDT